MKFEVDNPCDENWAEMELRGSSRFCATCQHSVIDMTRMSRAQAEARLQRARGDYACVRLRVDASGRAEFRERTSRLDARHTRGLVLASALTLGACSGARAESRAEVVAYDASGDSGEQGVPSDPMRPTTVAASEVAASEVAASNTAPPVQESTGPVTAELGEDNPTPTAAQRALTRRKQQQVSTPPPQIRRLMGRMPLRRR